MRINEKLKNRIAKFIDNRLNRSDIASICRLILIVTTVLFSISYLTQQNGRTIFGPPLGADFAAFYIAGQIFADTDPGRIYDRPLERERYHRMFSNLDPNLELPYLNAPFFILPFAILSRIPYPQAFICWVIISLLLFIVGFEMVWRTLRSPNKDDRSIMILISVSYMPFLVECLAGGQTSAFGFACISAAIYLESRGCHFASGAILAFCTYKPTLLILILPMLVITKRNRTIAGLSAGVAALALFSIILIGEKGSLNYLDLLLNYSRTTAYSTSIFINWKYVDLNSFFRSLVPGHTGLRLILLLITVMPLSACLIRFWRTTELNDVKDRSSLWAATVTMTMVLNIYLGIYDTTLMILSALLMIDAIGRRTDSGGLYLPRSWRLLCMLLYLVPWITQPIARLTGVQLFTIVLGCIGIYQMRHKHTGRSLAKDVC